MGKLAVVTGGGSGIGRELVVQLAAAGSSVATCDVTPTTLGESAKRAGDNTARGVRITTHVRDVSDDAAVRRFRDEVVTGHETDHVDVLFNSAGVVDTGSFVVDEREEWERVFGICWVGVYNTSRAFSPLLMAADRSYLVNMSSVAGFRASGFSACSTAKFAVNRVLRRPDRGLPRPCAAREGRARDAWSRRHRDRCEQRAYRRRPVNSSRHPRVSRRTRRSG